MSKISVSHFLVFVLMLSTWQVSVCTAGTKGNHGVALGKGLNHFKHYFTFNSESKFDKGLVGRVIKTSCEENDCSWVKIDESPSCKSTDGVSTIKDSQQLRDMKSFSSTLGGGYGPGKAALSEEFHSERKSSVQVGKTLAYEHVTCTSHTARVDLMNHGLFHPFTFEEEFLCALASLPATVSESCDKKSYFDFFNSFGTSVVGEVVMGAKFVKETVSSFHSATEFRTSGSSSSQSIHVGAFGVSADAGFSSSNGQSSSSESQDKDFKSTSIAYGCLHTPAIGGLADEHVQEMMNCEAGQSRPLPLDYTSVTPIADLIESSATHPQLERLNFQADHLKLLANNIRSVLLEFCQHQTSMSFEDACLGEFLDADVKYTNKLLRIASYPHGNTAPLTAIDSRGISYERRYALPSTIFQAQFGNVVEFVGSKFTQSCENGGFLLGEAESVCRIWIDEDPYAIASDENRCSVWTPFYHLDLDTKILITPQFWEEDGNDLHHAPSDDCFNRHDFTVAFTDGFTDEQKNINMKDIFVPDQEKLITNIPLSSYLNSWQLRTQFRENSEFAYNRSVIHTTFLLFLHEADYPQGFQLGVLCMDCDLYVNTKPVVRKAGFSNPLETNIYYQVDILSVGGYKLKTKAADSVQDTPQDINIHQIFTRECYHGCSLDLLGDGHCNSECNVKECAHDLGDCDPNDNSDSRHDEFSGCPISPSKCTAEAIAKVNELRMPF